LALLHAALWTSYWVLSSWLFISLFDYISHLCPELFFSWLLEVFYSCRPYWQNSHISCQYLCFNIS
jgi:hypothetical protein